MRRAAGETANPIPRALLLIGWLLLAAGLLPSARAEDAAAQAPATALRLQADQRIVLDGRLDDAAWGQAVPMADFHEVEPDDRAPPKVRTEVRFAFDDKTLYVAITAQDPDLAALRAPFSRRDDLGSDEDHITVYLDPTGQRKFAQFFDINPRGVLTDGLYNEQSGNEDISPDFRFEARTGRYDGGWTIELAIPFSSLRYLETPAQRWNVLVTRNYPRAEESYYIASGPMPRESNCMICYSRPLVGLERLPAARALSITPTLTLRRQQERDGSAAAQSSRSTRLGADLKLRLRPDLFLDATIRPDFSQVEVDEPQLSSNTRYAIYLPEKRPFFLEGSDILESPLRALHTRSITAPDWGVRVTRRGDDSDFAVIVARDQALGDILLPNVAYTESAEKRSKSLVTLARGRIHFGEATIGGVFTDRRHGGGLGFNRVFGLDASWNPTAEDRGDLQWLSSTSSALQSERGVPRSGQAVLARWSHKGEAWNALASMTDLGRGFRSDNGFFEEAGTRAYQGELRRKRRNFGLFNEIAAYMNLKHKAAHTGETLSRSAQLGMSAGLPLETWLWMEPLIETRERVQQSTPQRSLRQWKAGLTSVPSAWFNYLRFEALMGDQLDVIGDRVGRGRKLGLDVKLRPSQRVQLGYWLDELRIDLREGGGQHLLSERVQQVLGLLHLGANHHLRLILQWRDTQRNAALFEPGTLSRDRGKAASLTYQLRLGGSVTLDAGISTGRASGQPPDFRFAEKDVFVKLAWTFDR